MLCYDILFFAMLCLLCYAMSFVVLRYMMSCYVMLCSNVMLRVRHAVLRHDVLRVLYVIGFMLCVRCYRL